MCVQIGPEVFRAPEILFRPEMIGSEYRGVHDCLVKSVMKADMDLRRVLFSQMVLSGGSTMFPGLLCAFKFALLFKLQFTV
jgi:centractin